MTREILYATVIDNRDDQSDELDDQLMRGRIKVQCDTLLLADEDGGEVEFPLWCDPVFPFTGIEGSGWFFVPPVGAEVEIELDRNELGQVQDVRWLAGIYTDNADIPEQFKENYPERRGMRTPAGFTLMFDDTPGKELMTLSSPTGQFINFDEKGSTLISIASGSMVFINADEKFVVVADENGNLLQLNEDGMKLVDNNGNFITTDRNQIQIVSSADLIVSGNNVEINGGSVNIGDPQGLAFGAVLGDLMAAVFDSHVHICTAPGTPSAPPTIPMASLKGTPADPIAQYVKIKAGGFF